MSVVLLTRATSHCLGPSDVPPVVGCVNPGSDYFHTTGPIAHDDETRRIDGSVHYFLICVILCYLSVVYLGCSYYLSMS